MVAESVQRYDPWRVSPKELNCIHAAALQLKIHSGDLDPDYTAVFTHFPSCRGFTGCTVWFANLRAAKEAANNVINAFNQLLSTDDG